MHEIPSSHVSVATSEGQRPPIVVEPFNTDPIPGRREMTTTYSDGRQRTVILSHDNSNPIKVFAVSGENKTTPKSPLNLQEGKHYVANIDGRSLHPIQIDHELGTVTTDEQEVLAMPTSPESPTPIRSIAEITVTTNEGGEVRRDTTLIFLRQTS